MDQTISAYLADLGAPDELTARIESLLAAYERVLPERVDRHFVSEFLDSDGTRTFESLWLFSEHFAMEAKLLGDAEDQFDFVPHREGIRHVLIRKRDFDLVDANSSSRMSVDVWFTDQRYGVLKATGENASNLADLVKDLFLPNTTAT